MIISSAEDLVVFQKAYRLAMRSFEISKRFPKEEQYSLTDQVRRSSRSVCANLREAWAKRRYPAHFLSKLSDCDGENAETKTWLDFAKDCGYLSTDQHAELVSLSTEVGKLLGAIMKSPEKFFLKSDF
jgi:four helix bundle protein